MILYQYITFRVIYALCL